MPQRSRPPLLVGLFELLALWRRPVRVELILTLRHGPRDVSALAKERELDISQVSRELQALEIAGLVRHEETGHRHVYSLGPQLRVGSDGNDLVLLSTADNGVRIWIAIPPHVLRELCNEPAPPSIHIAQRGPPSSDSPRSEASPPAQSSGGISPTSSGRRSSRSDGE